MTDERGQVHSKGDTFGKVFDKLMHNLAITDGAVRLYAHMHWRFGRNRKNNEGQLKMAAQLGVSEKTIRNRIDLLESHGWVMTIYRDRKPDGHYATCHYHVFEEPADGFEFRQEYVPAEGESVAKLPEAKSRKTRKGAGNRNPSRPNSSSTGGQNSGSNGGRNSSSTGGQNSGSGGGRNSGSGNPDSPYPDSFIQTPSIQRTEDEIATIKADIYKRWEQLRRGNTITATDRDEINDSIVEFGLDTVQSTLTSIGKIKSNGSIAKWNYVRTTITKDLAEPQQPVETPATPAPMPNGSRPKAYRPNGATS